MSKKTNWFLYNCEDIQKNIIGNKEEMMDYFLEISDAFECLTKLTASKNGLAIVRSIMNSDMEEDFVYDHVFPLLSKLKNGKLAGVENNLVKVFYEVFDSPFVIQIIVGMVEDGLRHEVKDLLMRCFLDIFKSKLGMKLVENSQFMILVEMLLSMGNINSSVASQLATLSRAYLPNEDLLEKVLNIRDIQIAPRISDIMEEDVGLPIARDVFNAQNLVVYKDFLFRLLREDFMSVIREDVTALTSPENSNKRLRNYLNRNTVVINKIDGFGFSRDKSGVVVTFKDPYVLREIVKKSSIDLDEKEGREKIVYKFWKNEGKLLLQRESIVAIVKDNELLHLGVVVDRSEINKFRIVLSFESMTCLSKIMTSNFKDSTYKLVQLSASYFSYIHVLKKLQTLSVIPFENEILKVTSDEDLTYLPDSFENLLSIFDKPNDIRDLVGWKSKSLVLDESQNLAIQNTFKHRISLIQGPPGTGKSYTGALLCKMIYDYTKETILCVCYTNHALDQFLEDLIHFGIPRESFVRIGGRANDSVKDLSIFEQTERISKQLSRNVRNLKEQQNLIESDLENLNGKLANVDVIFKGSRILEYLENNDRKSFRALRVKEEWLADDGFTKTVKGGKDMTEVYLLNRWMNNKDRGILKNMKLSDSDGLWEKNQQERQKLISKWKLDYSSEIMRDIKEQMDQYESICDQIKEIYLSSEIFVVQSKRIVGCTTSGAAKYSALLNAYSAGVVVLEEAGEILESHCISSLSEYTKHLIMIGDHKQLRPKINSDQLSVESGGPYKLNQSLFERLILSEFPAVTLKVQHRMRPEISQFARITYPDLKDASTTSNRPDVKGCYSNVVFVNHDHMEDKDALDLASKTNSHEVGMILGIIRHLIYQGYKSTNMVVITPYLGQLKLLKSKLASEYQLILNDLDKSDLLKFDVDCVFETQSSKSSIRVATIDNYQGEEADIVLISLVRSNIDNQIGFCIQPERINVMLTRAKLGMILIGNRQCLENAKSKRVGANLWPKVFDIMDQNRYIFPGFPIQCQQHKTNLLINDPSQFKLKSRDGGCDKKCIVKLNCGHTCPKSCHIDDHSTIKCTEALEFMCDKLHSVYMTCSTTNDPNESCRKCHEEQTKINLLSEKIKLDLKNQSDLEALDKEIFELQSQLLKKEADENLQKLHKERLKSRDKLQETILKAKEPTLPSNSVINTKRSTKTAKNNPKLPKLSTELESLLQQPKSTLINHLESFNVQLEQKQPISKAIQFGILKSDWMQALLYFQALENVDDSSTMCRICCYMLDDQSCLDPIESTNGLFFHFGSMLKSFFMQEYLKCIGHSICFDKLARDVSIVTPWLARSNSCYTLSLTRLTTIKLSPDELMVKKWKDMNGESDCIDKLLELKGLQEIKQLFINLYKVSKIQDISKKRSNIMIMGNPGTGKTTVARIYATFLSEIGLINGDHFVEVSGATLAQKGPSHLEKLLEDIESNGGGMLFVDEAYQLLPRGQECLDMLLTEMENKIGKLVVAFAGYQQPMEAILSYNEGLPSRFPYQFVFADHSDETLTEILMDLVDKHDKEIVDDSSIPPFMNRLFRLRHKKGFGNARSVVNAFEKVLERQAERVYGTDASVRALTKEDFLGMPPQINSKAYQELMQMVGLKSVKKSIKHIIDVVQSNYVKECQNKPILECKLNRVFVGNPGTGKTTVAKLYGGILKDINMLSNGQVLLKKPADFIGSALGQSEQFTKSILSNSEGKVLVIDEAYGLHGEDPYKKAVIDTIVAEIQNEPGDDRCVVLIGYSDLMEEMMTDSNPGLKRRFNMESKFVFEDYSDDELMKMLNLYLRRLNLDCTISVKQEAIKVLGYQRNRSNFGNGGAVGSLVNSARIRMNSRQGTELIEEDVNPDYNKPKINLDDLFQDIMGCVELKSKFSDFIVQHEASKKRGQDSQLPTCFRFVGPPGTGKTTMARKTAEFFQSLEIIGSSDVVECFASDFIGQYVGHTSPKVKKLLIEGLDKVLFIDEAYRFNSSSFALEAVNELVDQLTKPQFKDKLVVILAGYKPDIDKLMGLNPGLSSRFPQEIVFSHFAPLQSCQLLVNYLMKSQYQLEITNNLQNLIAKLISTENWGNGRDLKTIGDLIVMGYNTTHLDELKAGEISAIPSELAESILKKELQKRLERPPSKPQTIFNEPVDIKDKSDTPLTFNIHVESSQDTQDSQSQDMEDWTDIASSIRDQGVDDATWKQLEQDKQIEKQKELDFIEVKSRKDKLKQQKQHLQDNKDKEGYMRLLAKIKEELENQKKEQQRLEEEQKKEKEFKRKLHKMGKCCAGFEWIKQENGYRCAGGSHFIGSNQLGL